MKRKKLSIIMGIMVSVLFTMTSFAQTAYSWGSVSNSSGERNNISVVRQEPRGRYISTGILQISNPGNGEIGVFMQTLTHIDVDETIFAISLERWIESEDRWMNVGNFEYSYSKEDYPDEDFSMKSISFNVVGQPSDCKYRLNGIHMVSVNGMVESLESQTKGVWITK